MKNIIRDLYWRHAVKKYDSTKTIDNKTMSLIKEALWLSPSSINSQPWKFIFIESDKAKRRLFNSYGNDDNYNKQHALDASATILFAHKISYSLEDYTKVVEKQINDNRIPIENKEKALSFYRFVEKHNNENNENSCWTKAQTYIALGNLLHTLSRLKIDSTPIEGLHIDGVNKEFKNELGGYKCELALAIGYRDEENDWNNSLPKSRLDMNDVIVSL